MARPPDRMREAAEGLSALASAVESADWTRRRFAGQGDAARMHARQHRLMVMALREIARLHLPEPTRTRREKASQLRLVA